MRQAVSVLSQAPRLIATTFAPISAHDFEALVRQMAGKAVIVVQATLSEHPHPTLTCIDALKAFARQ